MEAVPYAPPLPRIFPRGSETVLAEDLRAGDWVDDAPYYGRVEEVDCIMVDQRNKPELVRVQLREAGSAELLWLEHVDPLSHWTVVPDPRAEPLELKHPYKSVR